MFVSLSMLELFAFIFTGKEQFYTESNSSFNHNYTQKEPFWKGRRQDACYIQPSHLPTSQPNRRHETRPFNQLVPSPPGKISKQICREATL